MCKSICSIIINRIQRNNEGFTLIEVSASVFILTVICLSLYGLLNSSLNVWHRGQEYIEMNQQAQYSLHLIEDEILAGESAVVSADGKVLSVNTGNEEKPVVEFSCMNQGPKKGLYRVAWKSTGDKEKPVPLAEYVREATFQSNGRQVRVELMLQKRLQQLKVPSLVTIRRGGVY